MTEPPGARLRVALTGLTVAEYFRDEEGADTLLFIDNIFRFTQAGSEVSTLLGRMPSAVGYQPNLATEMGELQERITSTKKGSVTSVQAVYVPADDLPTRRRRRPSPTSTRPPCSRVRCRSSASIPAVDPLASTSRILSPRIVGQEHYDVAQGVKRILQRYKDLQDIIAILGIDELSEEDKLTVARARKVSASSRSPSTSPRSLPESPARTSRSRTRCAASRRSSRASTTTFPSRRSTSRAASKTCSRQRRRWKPRHRRNMAETQTAATSGW